MDPGEGKMLFRRTNEAEGSDDCDDGGDADDAGDDDDASTAIEDENGLDPAKPRGDIFTTSRRRRWSGATVDSTAAAVGSG